MRNKMVRTPSWIIINIFSIFITFTIHYGAFYVSSMAIELYIRRVLWLVKHIYRFYYRKWCLLLSAYWRCHFNQRLFTSIHIVINKSPIVHVLCETATNSIWSMQSSSDLFPSPSIAAPPSGRHLELCFLRWRPTYQWPCTRRFQLLRRPTARGPWRNRQPAGRTRMSTLSAW